MASREAILSALFTLVTGASFSLTSGATSFLTTGRRVPMWSAVTEQPALFLRDVEEDVTHPSVLSKTEIGAEIWVYLQETNPDAAASTDLNIVLDAVVATLAPDSPTRQLTLGGLVAWCRIEGKIRKWPGDIGQQAIMKIPVRISVPSILVA